MRRMRVGEWIALAGAVALLVLMFFDWFSLSTADGQHVVLLDGSLSGWSTLGWFMDVLVAVAIFGGLALSYMTVKRTSPAWPVGASGHTAIAA